MNHDDADALRKEFIAAIRDLRVEFVGAVKDLSLQLSSFTTRLELLTKEHALAAERSRLTACPKPGLCLDLESAQKKHDEQIRLNSAAIDQLRGAKKSLVFTVGLATAAAQMIQFAFWFFSFAKPGQ